MSHRPPRIALALLDQLLPEESFEAVTGDLVERFERTAESSPMRARLQFWRETLAALTQLQWLPDRITAFTPYSRESRMQSLLSDIRLSVRVLARAKGFTVICVATLAIAIGAATAIFSIANPAILSALPFPRPEQLVMVFERSKEGVSSRTGYATISDITERATVFSHTAAAADWDATFIGEHDAERFRGMRVSWKYFDLLGVRPVIGRGFVQGDDIVNATGPMIISHGLWVRRFGSDSSIVGREVDVNGVKRVVIGVMPPSYEDVLEPESQAWRVLGYGPTNNSSCRGCRHLQFIARLKPGVSREQADREVNGLALQLSKEHPTEYATPGGVVLGLQDRIASQAKPVLLALLGAVGALLLIAIANVTNLQLARAIRRDEEFAVRAALGAGRGRLAHQLFAEGLVLATLAGVAGTVVAAVALPLLVSLLPAAVPRLQAIRLDASALFVVAAIVLVVALVMGVAPAWQAGRRRLFDALRSGTRTLGLVHHRARSGIVVTEVALAMLLLAGAALLGRSLMRLMDQNAGFDASGLVTLDILATGTRYSEPGSVLANHERVLEAVRAVPGVLDVAMTHQLPLGGNWDRYGVAAMDKPLANPSLAPDADRYTVTPDFVRAMRIPILRGRSFTDAETRDTIARVTMVSDALAKRLWPGEDPIGKYIRVSGPTRPWWRVIGVTGNVRHTGLDADVTYQFYTAERQWWWEENAMTLVARVRGEPRAVAPAIREAVRGVDPLQPMAAVTTMDQVIARSTAQRRLGLVLFVAFGVIALLLATAGIYGVLAGSVNERTREFGVRTALGATSGAIARLVLREGAVLAAAGLAIGLGAALVLSRYLRTLLFGVEPTDPIAMLVGATIIAAVALAACLIPARRATRVDPMAAFRQ
jgi:putative ABC transport system permease protein